MGRQHHFYLSKIANDTANWSNPDMFYRIRFYDDKIKTISKVAELKEIFGSNTMAKNIHGYLGGYYYKALGGLYLNNMDGLVRIMIKYPDLVKTIQTYDQYVRAKNLADFMCKIGKAYES